MPENPGDVYDAYYYQTGCGRPYQHDEHWLNFFDSIAERIILEFHPRTVLDAGCAFGFLVETLRKRGVDAYGVDISEYAIANVDPDIRPYCWVGSVADPFPQKYDLIVTIEVLEHIPKEIAEKAIENICRSTDQVLFSSGDQDMREVTHINIQPAEYWAEAFARHGFFRDVDFDGGFITAWTVLFRRSDAPVHRVIMDYERKISRLLQENFAVRQVNLEQKNALAQRDRELNLELKDALAQREHEILALKNQISAILDSKTYRAGEKFQFLIPPDSRRERLALKVWSIISRIMHYSDQKKR